MHTALGELEAWIRELRSTGYRGLVLLHTSMLSTVLEILAERLRAIYSRIACIAPKELREGLLACSRVLSPSAIEELLGTDNEAAILATPRLLRPNLLAAAAETVLGGGVVAVVAPRLSEWRPGGSMTTGNYKKYLVSRMYELRSVFWADLDTDTIYMERLPEPSKPVTKREYRPRSPINRALLEMTRSIDQARGLDDLVHHFRKLHGRGALVLGDRGRGKSGLLGLFAAYLVNTHMVGFLPVTAPSPWSVQSFFRVLINALRRLGVRRFYVNERKGLVLGVTGPWFRIRYLPPDRIEPGSFTIIDEGAALGPLRLRLITAKSPRLIVASTIHGYEGSGRILARMVEEVVPEPRIVIELSTPIRYPQGDPLEEWLYDTFMLRVEPYSLDLGDRLGELRIHLLDRGELVDNYQLLREAYSVLVLAHYRNEPDDLALILDAPHHMLFAALIEGRVVAVADTSIESGESPYEARIIPDLLATSNPDAMRLAGLRIVRIAVHPDIQRRGIGSKLLSYIEDWARKNGLDWVGASFGQPNVIGFWLANSYLVAYVSPLPSKATGEHNIAVIKPLSNKSRSIITSIARDMLRRLLLASHSLYRGVPAEVLAEILRGHGELAQEPLAELTREQQHRLRMAVSGKMDIESALDAYWLILVNTALEKGGLAFLSEEERRLAIARVLQGKSLRDLVAMTGESTESVKKTLYSALRSLIGNSKVKSILEQRG